jgi:hypothetical protein
MLPARERFAAYWWHFVVCARFAGVCAPQVRDLTQKTALCVSRALCKYTQDCEKKATLFHACL